MEKLYRKVNLCYNTYNQNASKQTAQNSVLQYDNIIMKKTRTSDMECISMVKGIIVFFKKKKSNRAALYLRLVTEKQIICTVQEFIYDHSRSTQTHIQYIYIYIYIYTRPTHWGQCVGVLLQLSLYPACWKKLSVSTTNKHTHTVYSK